MTYYETRLASAAVRISVNPAHRTGLVIWGTVTRDLGRGEAQGDPGHGQQEQQRGQEHGPGIQAGLFQRKSAKVLICWWLF